MSALARRKCHPLPAGTRRLPASEIRRLLSEVPGWRHGAGAIRRKFSFSDYHQTMAFVNAVAWIAHREDHHPEMAVGYNGCDIAFNTHSIGGISLNDFICAAKINALLAQPAPGR